MNNAVLLKLLAFRTGSGKPFDITVTGTSMNPALKEGDVITVMRRGEYFPGDILVFAYKNGELLVHRLLKLENGTYFCKGDNAFRLEDIAKEQIIGKVISANGTEIPPCPQRLTALSDLVNRAFFACGYDAEKTRQTELYKLYEKVILHKGDAVMLYRKNEKMDYIRSDESSLAVYDAESGDTHFFDETGIDILELLSEPRDLDTLLAKLCEIYNAAPDDIREDVEEFLRETTEKKVVETL